uniref:Uncharacterized protein n=1 Tax=Ganoderma lucidum TaxID=5315 RepID=S4UWD1_GANLU|nr:hypothetical protein Galu_Mp17 [Ganoderma lucidum]YP_010352185.1 hypothetical protein MYE56_mgp08 [Ganoderma lingzhi]AGM47764.1 hypothetical protein Galu_Mp17 [Ganoderma lucidum]QUA00771.1 DNA polymerase [Ganoderma lucidum]UOL49725.1 hypothetical protein [Ganoderma lingzhi]UOL50016.1 hypothetical protein [Ganoderma lingzhi]UOL50127.1 hypothetical protein [Ganoderma lingzhi]
MRDLLTSIVLNKTICSVVEKGPKSGKTIFYMLLTSAGIISKISDRYTIYSQGKKIESLEGVVKDVKDLGLKVTNDVETIDASIEHPSHRELLQQSQEFKAKMAEYQRDKIQLIELDKTNTNSQLVEEGESIRVSLDNNENVPIEVINDYTERFEKSVTIAKEQLENLSEHLESFKEYVNKFFNVGNNNNFIDFTSIEKTITEIDTTIGMDNFVNYGGIILIVWCLISITILLLSNKILSTFQGRFHYLDRYLSYRKLFSKYYLKLEIITIIIIISLMLIYNIV